MGPRITQIGPAGSHGSREDTTIGGDSQSLHNKMQEITFLKYKNWLQYFSSKKRNSRKRMNKFFMAQLRLFIYNIKDLGYKNHHKNSQLDKESD